MYRRSEDALPAGDAIPFFHEGRYHLFHLESPAATRGFPERVRTTWRHAVSSDLAVWSDLVPALEPGSADDPDADGVWTGSVIVGPGGKGHVFYTGHRLGSDTPQTICHATSDDLVHWVKDERNPILLPDRERYEGTDWRDPYVFWNDEASCYWMLIAARLNSGPYWLRGCIALATSEDLGEWRLSEEPLYAPYATYCPECPELFELGGTWYLVYSRFSERAQTVYRYADTSSGPFRTPDDEGLDGRRFYAAKSFSDGERRLSFGWIHEREGGTDEGAWQWGGDFGLPRELVELAKGRLAVRIPPGLLREVGTGGADFAPAIGCWEQPAPGQLAVEATGTAAYGLVETPASGRFVLRCSLACKDMAGSYGILIRSREDLSRALVLVIEPRLQRVSVLEWPAPLDTFWAELTAHATSAPSVDGPVLVQHPFAAAEGEESECTVVVDGSLIEVAVGNRVCMSYRWYGDGRCSRSGLFVDDGQLLVKALRVTEISD